jgi:hypothetical protein
MTHEELLQEYAQHHADKWNSNKKALPLSPSHMMDEAVVTCAAVAEGIRSCKLIPWALITEDECTQYLIDNGYVADAAQEGKRDE